jgi:hypothetical protein
MSRAFIASVAAIALAAAFSGACAWSYVKGADSRDGEVAQYKADLSRMEAHYAKAAHAAQVKLAEEHAARVQAVAAADARATKEIAHAKHKYETDLAAVRAGALRVRLNGADCAAGGSGLPQAATAPGSVDGAAGALPEPVATNVLALRESIEHDAAQIRGLQAYIAAITGPPVSVGAANQPTDERMDLP